MRAGEAPDLPVDAHGPQRRPLARAVRPEPLAERVVDALDELDRTRVAQLRVGPPRLERPVVQRQQRRLRDAGQH
jgi:hypothetical protein